jgi:hypothetical protein
MGRRAPEFARWPRAALRQPRSGQTGQPMLFNSPQALLSA